MKSNNNIYISTLEKDLFGKYKKHILNLINKRINQKPNNKEYVEKHHIVPRSWGGSDKKENIVSLTGREHFLIHVMLVKSCVGDKKIKMTYAMWMMQTSRKSEYVKINSRIFSIIRKEYSVVLSERNKKIFKGEQNPLFGGHKKEAKEKMSTSKLGEKNNMYGKKHSIETLKKIKERTYVPPFTDEHKSFIITSRKKNMTIKEIIDSFYERFNIKRSDKAIKKVLDAAA